MLTTTITLTYTKIISSSFAKACKVIITKRDSVGRRSLCRSKSFKLTDFGTNQKPICNFLLVNNTNINPISHHMPDSHSTNQIIAFDRAYLCVRIRYQKTLRISPQVILLKLNSLDYTSQYGSLQPL